MVAFKHTLALVSNAIKHILSSLFIVEVTKACLTKPNLEIQKSSLSFKSLVVDSSIEPETSIIAIKGFLDFCFSSSNEVFTKTFILLFGSQKICGSSIISALNILIFFCCFCYFLRLFYFFCGFSPFFTSFSIKLLIVLFVLESFIFIGLFAIGDKGGISKAYSMAFLSYVCPSDIITGSLIILNVIGHKNYLGISYTKLPKVI